MAVLSFNGFAGVVLTAETRGDPEDPPVLLVHGGGALSACWKSAAAALAEAGRYAITVDLRGHENDPSELDTLVADVNAVLAALARRPVIVAAGLGGAAAQIALSEASAELAAGLVLVELDDAEPDPRLLGALDRIKVPKLVVRESSPAENIEHFNGVLVEFLEQRLPRTPLQYEAGSDARTLRDALGCFGTGITVVTTVDENGAPVGLTANSFTSVSLDPPLILFCLKRGSANLPIFERSGRFAVNVLHIGQQPTSIAFASRTADRFDGLAWETWESGVPILTGSLASFECDTHAVHDGGDHVVFIGRVRRAAFEPSRDPLLYFRGKYRRLHFA